jgi:uncharacterized protein YggE
MNQFLSDFQKNALVSTLVVVLILFLGIKTINEIKTFRYIGTDSPPANNTITVSGEGEIFAPADIAQFVFSVIETAPTVAEAQNSAAQKWNTILAHLKKEGVEERDIRTVHYGIEPQHAPQRPNVGWIPHEQREIVGYTVTQSAQVRVRTIEDAGKLLTAVGTLGARSVSGISFTIDDESALVAQAREIAIQDAREKARVLAQDLEVSLGRIVTFREHNIGIPFHVREARAMMPLGDAIAPQLPDIPIGENRIVVNVEIVFAIR